MPRAVQPQPWATVQSHITPPMHLDEWPDEDRSSRIVFIVQGVSPNMIRNSLDTFLKVLSR